jgi:hypothetical protein
VVSNFGDTLHHVALVVLLFHLTGSGAGRCSCSPAHLAYSCRGHGTRRNHDGNGLALQVAALYRSLGIQGNRSPQPVEKRLLRIGSPLFGSTGS